MRKIYERRDANVGVEHSVLNKEKDSQERITKHLTKQKY